MARHRIRWGFAVAFGALFVSALPVAAEAPTAGTVIGHVYGPDGSPVAGATVIASSGQSRWRPAIVDTTGSDGSYCLPELEARTYSVEVGAPDYGPAPASSEFTVPPSFAEITYDVRLQPLSAATLPDPPEVVYYTAGVDTIDFTSIVWGNGFHGWYSFVPQGGNPVYRTTAVVGPGNISLVSSSPYQWHASGLKPDTEYVITTVAYNQVGASVPGKMTVRTLPRVITPPPVTPAVTDIKVARTLAGRPVVTFKAPKNPVAIVNYALYVFDGRKWRLHGHSASTNTTITLKGLAAQKSYDAYIVAVVRQGKAESSPPFTFRTGPGRRCPIACLPD